jgi:hypothetical protein
MGYSFSGFSAEAIPALMTTPATLPPA